MSFLIYFYMFETADAARVRAARRPSAKPYAGAFAGEWTLRNPRNAREPGSETVPRETLRWSDWANALNGQRLVSWVREEVFPFHAGIAAEGITDFMADARLVIDEPTVLSQVVSHVNDLHLEQVDADTKGDLFEHVLRQIRQAGELGQFRTPRHPCWPTMPSATRGCTRRCDQTTYDRRRVTEVRYSPGEGGRRHEVHDVAPLHVYPTQHRHGAVVVSRRRTGIGADSRGNRRLCR